MRGRSGNAELCRQGYLAWHIGTVNLCFAGLTHGVYSSFKLIDPQMSTFIPMQLFKDVSVQRFVQLFLVL